MGRSPWYPFYQMSQIVPTTPEPADGGFWIEHYRVTRSQAAIMQYVGAETGQSDLKLAHPGVLTKLVETTPNTGHGTLREVWMTDGWEERRTSLDFFKHARGDVLILGLGLGMLPLAILRRYGDEVRSVTVVEIERRVAVLVQPHIRRHIPNHSGRPYDGLGLRIIIGDAFSPRDFFNDGVPLFDSIMVDIWPTINRANVDQYRTIDDLYRPLLRPGGYMRQWCEEYVYSDLERADRALVR